MIVVIAIIIIVIISMIIIIISSSSSSSTQRSARRPVDEMRVFQKNAFSPSPETFVQESRVAHIGV